MSFPDPLTVALTTYKNQGFHRRIKPNPAIKALYALKPEEQNDPLKLLSCFLEKLPQLRHQSFQVLTVLLAHLQLPVTLLPLLHSLHKLGCLSKKNYQFVSTFATKEAMANIGHAFKMLEKAQILNKKNSQAVLAYTKLSWQDQEKWEQLASARSSLSIAPQDMADALVLLNNQGVVIDEACRSVLVYHSTPIGLAFGMVALHKAGFPIPAYLAKLCDHANPKSLAEALINQDYGSLSQPQQRAVARAREPAGALCAMVEFNQADIVLASDKMAMLLQHGDPAGVASVWLRFHRLQIDLTESEQELLLKQVYPSEFAEVFFFWWGVKYLNQESVKADSAFVTALNSMLLALAKLQSLAPASIEYRELIQTVADFCVDHRTLMGSLVVSDQLVSFSPWLLLDQFRQLSTSVWLPDTVCQQCLAHNDPKALLKAIAHLISAQFELSQKVVGNLFTHTDPYDYAHQLIKNAAPCQSAAASTAMGLKPRSGPAPEALLTRGALDPLSSGFPNS